MGYAALYCRSLAARIARATDVSAMTFKGKQASALLALDDAFPGDLQKAIRN
jgi:hypothetical protein